MAAKRKWICFCVAAAFHLVPGCACSTEMNGFRRMISGVNGIPNNILKSMGRAFSKKYPGTRQKAFYI
ncbi:hypothetical protein CIPOMM044M_01475 [Citrobacter portucalensis]